MAATFLVVGRGVDGCCVERCAAVDREVAVLLADDFVADVFVADVFVADDFLTEDFVAAVVVVPRVPVFVRFTATRFFGIGVWRSKVDPSERVITRSEWRSDNLDQQHHRTDMRPLEQTRKAQILTN